MRRSTCSTSSARGLIGGAYSPFRLHPQANNTGWVAKSDTITVPAGRTPFTLELFLATWDRATVQLWVDNVAIMRSSGPGCLVAAQPLTWTTVPRP